MKYGICNETFQDWPFDKAFAFAAECGYTGVEFAPFTINKNAAEITPEQRREAREQARAAGLEVIGLHWLLAFTEGLYWTSPDADVRRRTSEYLRELARLCRDLGGEVMVLGSPLQRNLLPGVSMDEAMKYAADVVRDAEQEFANCGVVLALEPLGPQEGDFLVTADEGAALMDMIDSPQVRLHLDVKAMSSESLPIPEVIRKHGGRMAHFHANDANRRGPGMGDIDFVPILQTLKDVGYDGWVSVEVFDYEPGIEALAGDSIRYLKDCWAKVNG
ncbi:MAG: sugar phosphate isomerase/epimerase [Planctomycetales bacterium]|nr:sugar phosphate isomerase/epimerase [Planctomycetales bacterium]